MKNKKLFAILTLVCFMFTLMPVAAFAADTSASIQDDSQIVYTDDSIVLDVYSDGELEDAYYVVITTDEEGKVAYKKCAFEAVEVKNKKVTVPAIEDKGTYYIHLVDGVSEEGTTRAAKIVKQYNDAVIDGDKAAQMLIAESNVAMYDNKVVVKVEGGTSYDLAFVPEKNVVVVDENGDATMTMNADSGFDVVEVFVKLTDGDKAVAGADLKVKTNSSAVDAKIAKATNAAGLAKLEIAASSVAGDFKVYVEYGKAKAILEVTSYGLVAADIKTIGEPKAPIALDTDLTDPTNAGVYFNVTDANGNNVAPGTAGEGYKVAVVEKPADSLIDADEITLNSQTGGQGWGLYSATEVFDEEGTYKFKVMLANGAYANATVVVKEFQEPVELKIVYPVSTIELNGKIAPSQIVFVDANGVTRAADLETDEVKLSANGYAIEKFYANDTEEGKGKDKVTVKAGTVVVDANEKYVGSKITVLAVAEEYGLVAAAELSVANEAAGVKYATTKADVAINNTLVANIVDADGNKVALSNAVDTEIQYIVLDKPENAKVALSTKDYSKLVSQGQFKVSFTASEIGTYKVQTVVRYEQLGVEDNEPVVKYYSGIEDITVGNTGIEDVVVMSVGSNEIVVNSKIKAIDAAPIVENNRTFVPFRALAEAFGATVAYDEATQAVTAELNGTTVVMTIGSAEYTVNGVAKTADVAPFINGSRTMVPVRFVAEAFGITVTPTYNDNGTTADILFAK